ncbi:hypothetical protein TNIN_470171 [Trichonephila inaurata madagascariensis]|uniref:Uncharacterized protein n=1 Tax=Trichonephila inaurata madagascariensis TaxID=2747483 RepID=A0A8X6WZS6_9ARAC|nr:hypothetical protein TNIN_470171 [Trichonephila inaurata madagascariensis]
MIQSITLKRATKFLSALLKDSDLRDSTFPAEITLIASLKVNTYVPQWVSTTPHCREREGLGGNRASFPCLQEKRETFNYYFEILSYETLAVALYYYASEPEK